MTRRMAIALALAGGLSIAPLARAQQFEALAESATPVENVKALAALFWNMTGSCTGFTDDMQRRQCEGVRQARAEANAGRTYRMVGDGSALQIGAYDGAKGWNPISVRGCLACAQTVEVSGESRYVVTRGAVAVQGGALAGPELKRVVRKSANQTDAEKWMKVVAPRLRVEVLFKVPAKAQDWSEGPARGYAVELVGFRVVDPCDGSVLASDPASNAAPPDRAACIGETEAAPEPLKPPEEVKPAKPIGPAADELPERPTPAQISSSMQRARADVNACFANYGVAGKADLQIEISGDGTVKGVKLLGDFVDTPTGDCIVAAVKTTTFPKFRAPSVNIRYPFILR